MIRLNLIEAADGLDSSAVVQPINVASQKTQEGGKKKNLLTIVVAAATVIVVGLSSMVVFGVPKALEAFIPTIVLDVLGIEHSADTLVVDMAAVTKTGSAGSMAEQRGAGDAKTQASAKTSVASFVAEVQPTIFEKAKRTSYKDYLPLEKIQYQKASLGQFISFIQTATPDDIGFSNLVFEAPNFYYVRGVADAPLVQRSFLERLKSVSVDYRTPPIPENAPATDITAFGSIKLEHVNVSMPVNEFLAADSVDAELANFIALAAAGTMKISGLAKPETENFGTYKRLTYTVKAVSDFAQVHAFILGWKESPLRLGVRRAVLERRGKDIAVTFILDAFVKP